MLLTVFILNFNLFSCFNHNYKLPFRIASLPQDYFGQKLHYLNTCRRDKVATHILFLKAHTEKEKMDVIIFSWKRNLVINTVI